ncbi:hypothetical protein CEXT_648521 [Caerostris extrusa]|uniref:Secreted protein n=1 Tax=Caerostris extrusa TaxID=172846 RepID=A0AAV4MN85_CAEEX|nr:hypothetical protein CEXT_648521 [Caerostris extrusa]
MKFIHVMTIVLLCIPILNTYQRDAVYGRTRWRQQRHFGDVGGRNHRQATQRTPSPQGKSTTTYPFQSTTDETKKLRIKIPEYL